MVRTVHANQEELLMAICELYGIKQFDLDPCYSKGNFYKGDIPVPRLISDIEPASPFVEKADAAELCFSEGSMKAIIFDPPFLATKGPSLSGENGNLMAKRFSFFPSESELFKFYFKCMSRFYLFLEKDGLLVFKCQDKVSSGKQYFSHCLVYELALAIGFYPKDLFVLFNERKMLGKWAKGPQKHALKTHSYFWVFQKTTPKVTLDKLLRGGE